MLLGPAMPCLTSSGEPNATETSVVVTTQHHLMLLRTCLVNLHRAGVDFTGDLKCGVAGEVPMCGQNPDGCVH